jgi:hypothetical protein
VTDPDLTVAAARFVLGILPSEEIPRIADALLVGGSVFPSAVEVSGTRSAAMAEVGPSFVRLLQETGTAVPSRDEALRLLLRYHLTRIALRAVSPQQGLQSVMDEVVNPGELHGQTRQFVGDSHDAAWFVGAYWDYRELSERPDEVSVDGLKGEAAVLALDEHVVGRAAEWLAAHSA